MSTRWLGASALILMQIGLAAHAAPATVEQRLDQMERELQDERAETAALKQQVATLKQELAVAQSAPAPTEVAQSSPPTSGNQPAPGAQSVASNDLPKPPGGLSLRSGLGTTTLGGYGELNYNRYSDRSFGNPNQDRADVQRAVIFISHQFNDRLSFASEFEWEGAVTSSDDLGEVEVEQAHLDYHFDDRLNLKAGLFLIPLGLLNENHEPNAYFGVERNEVETRIIPTTYREGGVGLYGDLGHGLDYDVGVTTYFNSGKPVDPETGVRETHQELSRAVARDLAIYGSINYRGTPGLLVGATVISGGTGQNGQVNTTEGLVQIPLLEGVKARLTIWDVHAKYSIGKFDFRALYAGTSLADAGIVSQATGVTTASSMYGWYVEGAYHLFSGSTDYGDYDIAPYLRFEQYNTQASVPAGLIADPLNDEHLITGGLNFMLTPQVVFKIDYQKYFTDPQKDRLNLGVGYQF